MSELGRLLEQLDADDLARLAERLRSYVAPAAATAAAYTPSTLATELGRSERSIRAAISRGELHATKRGRGYVISADAVRAWATAPQVAAIPTSRRPYARSSSPGPARRALQSRP